MPLMTITSCRCSPSSASACSNADRTPKSPQPGHQSGSTLPLKSFAVSGARVGLVSTVGVCVSTDMFVSLHHDFVRRHVNVGFAGENRLDALDDVMRHERFAVVLADVAVRRKAGLAAQVAGKLAAVVILHNDDLLTLRKNGAD